MTFSRGSSQPRDQTQVSHIAGGFFTSWATREAHEYWRGWPISSPGDLSNPGIEPGSPSIAGRFFTSWATREAIIVSKFFFIFGSISIEMSGKVLFNFKHCWLMLLNVGFRFIASKGVWFYFPIGVPTGRINFIFLRLPFKPCYDKSSVDLIWDWFSPATKVCLFRTL